MSILAGGAGRAFHCFSIVEAYDAAVAIAAADINDNAAVALAFSAAAGGETIRAGVSLLQALDHIACGIAGFVVAGISADTLVGAGACFFLP